MKILKIYLYNLNSLKETVAIDFSKAPFVDVNLFAITGETGAGKTTLLDAITLALYGKVARDCDVKEVISYGAVEAFSEVEFQVKSGIYRAKWSIARARKKSDGKLQEAERELAKITTQGEAEILATKKSEVRQKIAELTQLEYDQFTKSVLLAQGDFAAFLKAKKNERGKLLERVTGTEIYSKISEAAFLKAKYWRERKEKEEEKLAMVTMLQDDEKEEIRERIEKLAEELTQLETKQNTLQKQENWFERFHELTQQKREVEGNIASLKNRKEQNCSTFKQLEQHKKALPLEALFNNWKYQQRACTEIQQEITILTETVKTLNAQKEAKKVVLADETGQIEVEKKSFEEQRQQIEKAISLDSQVEELSHKLAQEKAMYLELKSECKTEEEKLDSLERQLANQNEQWGALQQWLTENAILSSLHEQFEVLKERIHRVSQQQVKLREKKHLEEQLLKEQASSNENAKVLRDKATQQQASIEKAQKEHRYFINELAEKLNGLTEEELYQQQQELLTQKILLEEKQTLLRQYEEKNLDDQTVEKQIANHKTEIQTIHLQQRAFIEKRNKEQELFEALEQNVAYAQKFLSLEEHRAELKPGEPCPLCGSVHHPSIEEKPTTENDLKATKEKFKQAKTNLTAWNDKINTLTTDLRLEEQKLSTTEELHKSLSSEIKTLQEKLDNHFKKNQYPTQEHVAQREEEMAHAIQQLTEKLHYVKDANANIIKQEKALTEHQLNAKSLNSDVKEIEQKIAFQKTKCQEVRQETETLEKELEKTSTVLYEQAIDYAPKASSLSFSELLTILEELKNTYSIKMKEKESLSVLVTALEKEKEGHSQKVNEQQKRIADEKMRLTNEFEAKEALRKKRITYFSDMETRPKEFLQQKMSALEQKEQALKQKEKEYISLVESIKQKKERNAALEVKLKELKTEEKTTELELAAKVAESGFLNLEAFEKAFLPQEEANRIENLKQEIEQGLLTATHTEQSINDALKKLETSKPSIASLEVLRTALATLSEDIDELRQHKFSHENKLKEDENNKKQAVKQFEELNRIKTEYNRWESLSELIGSANGDKFRIFAQTLTLERLVFLANQYLKKLYERYKIEIKNDDKLGLQIVDTYQADHIRSMETLSGGESFIVSLALALALSDMAGKNANIGTLFIDEGFGTLDPATLDVVIATLENLQSMGKTIGIISHVQILKERIHTQIQVKKRNGGTSTVKIVG